MMPGVVWGTEAEIGLCGSVITIESVRNREVMEWSTAVIGGKNNRKGNVNDKNGRSTQSSFRQQINCLANLLKVLKYSNTREVDW